jgi:uncharacterized lipoprotein YajG
MKKFKVTMVIVLLLVLGNCTHKVTLDLQPNFSAKLEKQNALTIQPAIKFFKGNFQDKRTDISKLATFKQQVHTYNLFAGRPIEDAIFEGLQQLFTGSGHEWGNDTTPEVRVNLQLLNVQASRNAGFVKVTAASSIQIKLDFVDAEGKVIYSEVYNGKDDRGQALVGFMNMVKKSVDDSIINCINNVGKDEDLARALKKFKGH